MEIKNINTINEALIKFLTIIGKKEKDLIFLYKGKKIEINNKKLMYKLNNNIRILVINKQMNKQLKNKNDDYITCPICSNLSYLNINKNDYNISLYNCVNNHQINNLSIDEYIKNQNKDKIKCAFCNNSKNLYNQNFFICTCGKYLCKLCSEKHNIKNHNVIEYDKRYTVCNNHGKEFISYCKDCKKIYVKNAKKSIKNIK